MRVVVIGSGNVAEAFAWAISDSSMELIQIYGRNRDRVGELSSMIGCDGAAGDGAVLAAADLYIVAVSDSAVGSVTAELSFPDGAIIAHTAASVDIANIYTRAGIKKAVIYPMQTFTKGRRLSFKSLPLFLEAESESTYLEIEKFALALTDVVIPLSSNRRRELHLAAVFSCNFTMAMLTATQDILRRCELPLELYEPLMRESIDKAFTSRGDIREALTGPAVRGDMQTQMQHIGMLGEEPTLCESEKLTDIYKIISDYIWETSKRI